MDIVTITLNPALDLTARLEAMSLGEVNPVNEANLRAAGKGINVAMVLKDLGRDVGVTGWLGADNQQSFVSLFTERATGRSLRARGGQHPHQRQDLRAIRPGHRSQSAGAHRP